MLLDLFLDKVHVADRDQVFHDQLKLIMQPIFEVMRIGINLLCGDGNRRLCFPRLCAFMGDYEEAWRSCGVKHGYCVKCRIPSTRRRADPTIDLKLLTRTPRTGEESLRLRNNAKNTPQASKELKDSGYHPVDLFTDDVPFLKCSIFDAIAPDLLHQASKNFRDQIYDKWRQAIIKEGTVTEDTLDAEMDARFQHIPAYTGLRWFRNGISKISRWTDNEYKEMMRIFIGISRGVGGGVLASMLKLYLDIHRLSHYTSHSDQELGHQMPGTLQYLEEALSDFWECLRDRNNLLIETGVIREDFTTNKLHAMDHYTAWIRQKGSLPQYSTDRTEGLHSIYKRLWRASNKGHEADKTVAINEWRTIGMLMFNEELRQEAMMEIRAARGLEEPRMLEGTEFDDGNEDAESRGLGMDGSAPALDGLEMNEVTIDYTVGDAARR